MTRRPWLALVVLVLIGISATVFVRSARASRIVDDYALAFDDDSSPCEVPPVVVVAELPRVATLVDEVPLAVGDVGRDHSILAIAPKTSPPS